MFGMNFIKAINQRARMWTYHPTNVVIKWKVYVLMKSREHAEHIHLLINRTQC